ncbi:MAG: FAD:protein FMN transferase, partial [Candidatus Woesearchaeota archaeon]
MHTKDFFYLGTKITITVPKTLCFSLIENELKRIEQKFSRFISTSKLSELNSSIKVWQYIDTEFTYLCEKALEFRKNTRGYFDISLKSHLEASGYNPSYSFKPSFLSLVKSMFTSKKVPYILKKQSIYLHRQIEFGGFGKGYAADRIAKICDEKHCQKYYINMGGDILCKG